MKKYAEYIQQVEIAELWNGRKHIVWHLDPEVNVLSGANGIGKSTILNRVVSGVKSLDVTRGCTFARRGLPHDRRRPAGHCSAP